MSCLTQRHINFFLDCAVDVFPKFTDCSRDDIYDIFQDDPRPRWIFEWASRSGLKKHFFVIFHSPEEARSVFSRCRDSSWDILRLVESTRSKLGLMLDEMWFVESDEELDAGVPFSSPLSLPYSQAVAKDARAPSQSHATVLLPNQRLPPSGPIPAAPSTNSKLPNLSASLPTQTIRSAISSVTPTRPAVGPQELPSASSSTESSTRKHPLPDDKNTHEAKRLQVAWKAPPSAGGPSESPTASNGPAGLTGGQAELLRTRQQVATQQSLAVTEPNSNQLAASAPFLTSIYRPTISTVQAGVPTPSRIVSTKSSQGLKLGLRLLSSTTKRGLARQAQTAAAPNPTKQAVLLPAQLLPSIDSVAPARTTTLSSTRPQDPSISGSNNRKRPLEDDESHMHPKRRQIVTDGSTSVTPIPATPTISHHLSNLSNKQNNVNPTPTFPARLLFSRNDPLKIKPIQAPTGSPTAAAHHAENPPRDVAASVIAKQPATQVSLPASSPRIPISQILASLPEGVRRHVSSILWSQKQQIDHLKARLQESTTRPQTINAAELPKTSSWLSSAIAAHPQLARDMEDWSTTQSTLIGWVAEHWRVSDREAIRLRALILEGAEMHVQGGSDTKDTSSTAAGNCPTVAEAWTVISEVDKQTADVCTMTSTLEPLPPLRESMEVGVMTKHVDAETSSTIDNLRILQERLDAETVTRMALERERDELLEAARMRALVLSPMAEAFEALQRATALAQRRHEASLACRA